MVDVTVVAKDEDGAEFVADSSSSGGNDDNESARSTWTVKPVGDARCTLTIDATQSMNPVAGVAMKPALTKLFYGINFTPFIDEAERRAKAA